MRFRRRAAALVAVGAAAAVTLAACAGSSDKGDSGGSGGSKAGGQLVYGADQFPENWNPYINAGNGTATANAVVRVLPAPFTVNPQFKPIVDPDFLTGEPVASKGPYTATHPFTVTMNINPKAKWSDGKPITAEDMRFNWQTNNPNDPQYGANKVGAKGCQTIVGNYDLIKDVTGGSGRKVVYTYYKPFADYLSIPPSGILPEHIVKQSTPAATCAAFNKGWSANAPLPFSGGPWSITKVNHTQQTFTLTPNKQWGGKKPSLSRLIYKVVPTDADSLANGLQNNETQMVYPQPQIDLLQKLKGVTDAKTEVNFGLSFEHIDFNTTNPYLKDKVMRQAIALAIDRQDVVTRTVHQFDARAKVLNNRILVNNQDGYRDNAPDMYKKRNLAMAKSMLQKDGYTFSGGKLTKGGKQVAMNIVTTANNKLRADTEQVVQTQLKDLGIAITPKQVPAETFFGDYKTQGSLNAGDCDLCLYAWVGGPFLTGNVSIYHSVPNGADGKPDRSREAQNSGLGGDPQVDKLMGQAQTTTDKDQAIALWNSIDQALWGDMFTLPLYAKPTLISFNNKYKNIGDNASSTGPLWNSDVWSRE